VSYAHAGALIKQLDLIICVDCSLAHLSASLGIPTWVLLDHNPSWHWMEKDIYNPWYPKMHLFRQSQQENWQDNISKVKNKLANKIL